MNFVQQEGLIGGYYISLEVDRRGSVDLFGIRCMVIGSLVRDKGARAAHVHALFEVKHLASKALKPNAASRGEQGWRGSTHVSMRTLLSSRTG